MIRIFWKKGEPSESWAFKERILGKGREIKKGPYGKPYLEEGPFFSLSHSGGLIAMAVGEQELGLDLEGPRAINHKGFIHPEEEGIDPLTLWVIKESFMKYTGEGIRQFRSVRVEKKEENLYWVTDGGRSAYAQTFQIENGIGAVTAEKKEKIKTEQIG